MKMHSLLVRLKSALLSFSQGRKVANGKPINTELENAESAVGNSDSLTCCSGVVHIAYRGVSDDRLYLSENRNVNEVKFYRQNGLRVFCSKCRRRLL